MAVVAIEAKLIPRAGARGLGYSRELAVIFTFEENVERSRNNDFHAFSQRRPDSKVHTASDRFRPNRKPPLNNC